MPHGRLQLLRKLFRALVAAKISWRISSAVFFTDFALDYVKVGDWVAFAF